MTHVRLQQDDLSWISIKNMKRRSTTPMQDFPVMDQTSLIWHKKIKAMEKVEPRSPIYPLMTTAKYLQALDTLYIHQEQEFKIQALRLKEVEIEA